MSKKRKAYDVFSSDHKINYDEISNILNNDNRKEPKINSDFLLYELSKRRPNPKPNKIGIEEPEQCNIPEPKIPKTLKSPKVVPAKNQIDSIQPDVTVQQMGSNRRHYIPKPKHVPVLPPKLRVTSNEYPIKHSNRNSKTTFSFKYCGEMNPDNFGTFSARVTTNNNSQKTRRALSQAQASTARVKKIEIEPSTKKVKPRDLFTMSLKDRRAPIGYTTYDYNEDGSLYGDAVLDDDTETFIEYDGKLFPLHASILRKDIL